MSLFRFAPTIVAVLAACESYATFPIDPLDCDLFDYSSDQFYGQGFGFGTSVSYTEFDGLASNTDSTGLQGFFADPSLIQPVPGFLSGDTVPVVIQNQESLFPIEAPPEVMGALVDGSISGVGDFDSGFSEFSLQQRKFAEVGQDGGLFKDLFVESKGFATFDLWSMGAAPETVNAELLIDITSQVLNDEGGSLSEGFNVQLLDVTDEENPTLMNEVGGFFFNDENGLQSSFTMGDQDLGDNFFFDPVPDGEGLIDAEFIYSMEVLLDPNKTYAFAAFSDASAGVTGQGIASFDARFTLHASIRVLDPEVRMIVPGQLVVPEPASLATMLVGTVLIVRRRINR